MACALPPYRTAPSVFSRHPSPFPRPIPHLQAEAEAEWGRVSDPRYRDRTWLARERRWPPKLVAGLEAFLDIRS